MTIYKVFSDMEAVSGLLSSLITGIRRAILEGVTASTIDRLLTLADRLLRIFVMLLAVSSADLVMADNVRNMQEVVYKLEGMLHAVNSNEYEDCSYRLRVSFSGDRGRPRIVITRQMLEYFFGYGFSATTTARLLHVSLRTLRRRMSEFGILITNLYSDIDDEELDRMVTTIQHQYPNCGYRMMQGHLIALNHRVQQGRVRESMSRTDPHGVISRWCNTVVRRTYSVQSPNSLWHIDGNHRLIRYTMCVL